MACVARFFYAINHQFGFAGNVNFFIMLPGRKTRYNDNNFYSGFIQLYLGFHLRCTVFGWEFKLCTTQYNIIPNKNSV